MEDEECLELRLLISYVHMLKHEKLSKNLPENLLEYNKINEKNYEIQKILTHGYGILRF